MNSAFWRISRETTPVRFAMEEFFNLQSASVSMLAACQTEAMPDWTLIYTDHWPRHLLTRNYVTGWITSASTRFGRCQVLHPHLNVSGTLGYTFGSHGPLVRVPHLFAAFWVRRCAGRRPLDSYVPRRHPTL